jgi:hypothetical protein
VANNVEFLIRKSLKGGATRTLDEIILEVQERALNLDKRMSGVRGFIANNVTVMWKLWYEPRGREVAQLLSKMTRQGLIREQVRKMSGQEMAESGYLDPPCDFYLSNATLIWLFKKKIEFG